MDWNWFFSSLSQSVAALVGVFSAFVITKIISNQSDFARKTARTHELLDTSSKYKDAASLRYFNWLNERRMESAMEDLETLLQNEEKIQAPEEYYGLVRFPQYVPRAEVIEKIKERLPDLTAVYQHASAADDFTNESDYKLRTPLPISRLELDAEFHRFKIDQEQRLRDSVERESERIENLLIDVRQQIRLVKQQLTATENNPESSRLINFSIACALVLFFVGVIYPLSFLPYVADSQLTLRGFFSILMSVKGVMLLATSVVFLALTGVFWRVNASLKYSVDELQKLREAGELGYYSNYFKIRADNLIQHKEWLQRDKVVE